jgi:hypothetical protein
MLVRVDFSCYITSQSQTAIYQSADYFRFTVDMLVILMQDEYDNEGMSQ